MITIIWNHKGRNSRNAQSNNNNIMGDVVPRISNKDSKWMGELVTIKKVWVVLINVWGRGWGKTDNKGSLITRLEDARHTSVLKLMEPNLMLGVEVAFGMCVHKKVFNCDVGEISGVVRWNGSKGVLEWEEWPQVGFRGWVFRAMASIYYNKCDKG